MRRKFLITLCLVVSTLSWRVTAQELKVGAVNLGILLVEAPQAQKTQQSLENEFGSRRDQLKNQQQQLRSAVESLQQNGEILDQAELHAEKLKLNNQQRQLANAQEVFLEEVNKRRNQALSSLQKLVLSEIERYASEQNYDLVVGEGVILSSAKTDITSQVLTALKTQFGNQGEEAR